VDKILKAASVVEKKEMLSSDGFLVVQLATYNPAMLNKILEEFTAEESRTIISLDRYKIIRAMSANESYGSFERILEEFNSNEFLKQRREIILVSKSLNFAALNGHFEIIDRLLADFTFEQRWQIIAENDFELLSLADERNNFAIVNRLLEEFSSAQKQDFIRSGSEKFRNIFSRAFCDALSKLDNDDSLVNKFLEGVPFKQRPEIFAFDNFRTLNTLVSNGSSEASRLFKFLLDELSVEQRQQMITFNQFAICNRAALYKNYEVFLELLYSAPHPSDNFL